MKLDSLRVNALPQKAFDWYLGYLKAVDEKDLTAYGSYLAEDCVLYLNNLGPITGKAQILAMLAQYWPSFAGLEHELLNVYGCEERFVLEALNHYTRHDGKIVTIRAVAFTDRNAEGLVESARVYSDTAPLFA